MDGAPTARYALPKCWHTNGQRRDIRTSQKKNQRPDRPLVVTVYMRPPASVARGPCQCARGLLEEAMEVLRRVDPDFSVRASPAGWGSCPVGSASRADPSRSTHRVRSPQIRSISRTITINPGRSPPGRIGLPPAGCALRRAPSDPSLALTPAKTAAACSNLGSYLRLY